MSSNTHYLVVIGAGPAGMSAALTAASCGLKTMLLDEQLRPGGQIYQCSSSQSQAERAGHDARLVLRHNHVISVLRPKVKLFGLRCLMIIGTEGPLQEWGSVS